MLATGAAWLRDQIKANAAETVTYTRGAGSASVPATVGRTISDQPIDDSGATVKSFTIDFLIDGDELVISSAAITPQPGDTITRSDGSVYEVTPLGTEPCFRPSTPHGTLLRIHTIRITA